MTITHDVSSRLRCRMTLQQAQNTADGAGGVTRGWSDVVTLWAAVEPLNGHEHVEANKLASAVTHRITIRYRSDVSALKRFVMDGRAFNIRAVLNRDERDALMEILAQEGVAT